MDSLNPGTLPLVILAIAFSGLQLWWIGSTLRRQALARPLNAAEFRRSLERIWARKI